MNRAMWTGMLGLVLAGAGCGTGPASSGRAGGAPPSTHIFVVGHGWHAGITIRRSDLEEGQWPEAGDFPEADYLEVGWGDAAYYRADDPGLGTTLRAGLWPTPSVLHVAGFTRPPSEAFPHSEIIPVPVTEGGLEALVAYIRAEYARDEAGRVQDAGSGLYRDSRFYWGQRRYHVFNNCNHWTARALRAAGLEVRTARALTVKQLLRQVRRRVEAPRPAPSAGEPAGV